MSLDEKNGNKKLNNGSKEKTKTSLLSTAKALWTKHGFTWSMYKMMFKGALAPTIIIAFYQSDAVASLLSTLDYLTVVVAILGVCFRPRATYLQGLVLNILFVGITLCVLLLAMFCTIKAREHSGQQSSSPTAGEAYAGVPTSPYNSSASAVMGVWLFVMVYFLSIPRAFGKKFLLASILGSIAANIGAVYGAQLETMQESLTFVKGFTYAFFIGLGMDTAVNVLIFPVSSRKVVFIDIQQYVSAIKSALQADIAYVKSLEDSDMFTLQRSDTVRHRVLETAEASAVKTAMKSLSAKYTKFQTDLPFAKKEFGWSYLGAEELQRLSQHLRSVTLPMIGLSSTPDVFRRYAEEIGWDEKISEQDSQRLEEKERAVHEWNELVRRINTPFQDLADLIEEGIDHAMITLKLLPQKDVDVEKEGSYVPGSAAYHSHYVERLRESHATRKEMLITWCKVHGVEITADFFDSHETIDEKLKGLIDLNTEHREGTRMRKQLYLLLFMEYLLRSIGRRTEDLITFVEELKANGKLSKKRFIYPNRKQLYKWMIGLFSLNQDEQDDAMQDFDQLSAIRMGEALRSKRDPMHDPPKNRWEKLGNGLRAITNFLRSHSSVFAFRVAVATLSIGIIALLEQTQAFFTANRLFWVLIMVAIGLQPTALEGIKVSTYRILATLIFMLIAWVNWYIVNGQTAGVLVFFFVFQHLGPYIMLKYPRWSSIGLVGPITVTIIIGYQLQVEKLGPERAASNGQTVFPVYIVGPIRAATVIVGLAVGYFWTIFPFPVTEHQKQKETMANLLYLMARYYSVTFETVRLRIRGLNVDEATQTSISKLLAKTRRKIYLKGTILLGHLHEQAETMDWDVQIGGRFPRQKYDVIAEILQNMLNSMVVISYASSAFTDVKDASEAIANRKSSAWLATFQELVSKADMTSQNFTTLMSLMAASLSNSQPLPPFLKVEEPYRLSKQLDSMDKDILSVRHVMEPVYSSFAVLQISLKYLHDDLSRLLPAVKDLVGELDFSLEVIEQEVKIANENRHTA